MPNQTAAELSARNQASHEAARQRETAEERERRRAAILERLAKGQPLRDTLEAIVAHVECESPAALGSILLLDEKGQRLLHGAARRLPAFYCQAVHGIEIGPMVGSCGTAAFTGKRVIVEDIQTHPNWANYRDLARKVGLRACWSEPIVSSTNRVLGAFAIYHATPHRPTTEALDSIFYAAHLASLAIERARNEEALRANEKKYRDLVETTHDLIWSVDLDGRWTFVNQRGAEAIYGYTPEEMIGRRFLDFLADERENADLEVFAAILAGKPVFGHETRHVRKDGAHVTLSFNAIALQDAEGRVIGTTGTARDVSDQKRAAAAVSASQRMLRLVMDNIPQGVFWKDRNSRYLGCNRVVCDAFGLKDSEEIIGKDDRQLSGLTPEQAEFFVQKDREVMEENTPHLGIIEPARLADGSLIWMETSKIPMQDEEGAVIGVLGTWQDITERKRAEETLRERDTFLQMSQQTGHVGSWQWDLVTQRVKWSAEMYRIHGLDPDSFPETLDASVQVIHPEDRPTIEQFVQRILREGIPPVSVEFRILRPNGEIRTVFGRGEVARDAAGKPLRMIGTLMDITERKLAEEEHRRFEAHVRHTQKLESLGVLAGGIAHDFNNLLTGILGYADLAMQELPASSPARQLIGEAVQGAKQAAELTKQMLAYSGKGRFVTEAINLSKMMEDMCRLLQVSISKKCALSYRLAPNPPTIEVDPSQVRQIIMNLIINASEAIGERGGSISVRTGSRYCDRAFLAGSYLDENLPEGLYVFLEVADTGCGMSEEAKTCIFDPFYTTKFTGRGLGLSAVLGIVRGHRGAIQIESVEGKGTTFRVFFPAALNPTSASAQTRIDDPDWRGQGVVLIVDDESTVRGMASRMMESLGFSVLAAVDGLDAVEIFRREADRIAFVLLDMTMPKLDGEEALREMQRIRSDVKAILTSGFNEQVTSRFGDNPPEAFIQKPYRFEELRSVVRAVIERTD